MSADADGQAGSRHRAMKVIASACVLVAFGVSVPDMPIASAATAPAALTSSQNVEIQTQMSRLIAGMNPALRGNARSNEINQALRGLAQTDAAVGPAGISALVAAAVKDDIAPVIVVDAVVRGADLGAMPPAVAISVVTRSAIGAGASATQVTAQVIVTGMSIPLSETVIGSGLGTAAAELASVDLSGAREIGQTVANDGSAAIGTAYASAVRNNGGSEELAALGTASPEVTGATNVSLGAGQNQGGNLPGDNNNGQGNLGEDLPPCGNPSCT